MSFWDTKLCVNNVGTLPKIEVYEKYINLHIDSHFVNNAREKIAQINIERIFSNDYNPLLKQVDLSQSSNPIAKLVFKNTTLYPLTFYLHGKETFSVTFQPDESGSIEFFSGKYRLAIQMKASPGIVWAGEAIFHGKHILYYDKKRKTFGIIGIDLRTTRYSKSIPYPFASPSDIEAYNKEVDRLKAVQTEMEASIYPLKRTFTLKKLLLLRRSGNEADRLIALSGLERTKSDQAVNTMIDMLSDNGLRGNVLKYLRSEEKAIWPLIGIIKQSSDNKDFWPWYDPSFMADLSSNAIFKSYMSRERRTKDLRLIEEEAKTLVEIREGVADAIIQSLKYIDENTQATMLFILGGVAEPSHEDFFLKALEEADDNFKIAALIGLGRVGTEKSVNPLLKTLHQNDLRYIREGAFSAIKNLIYRGEFRITVTPGKFSELIVLHDEWKNMFPGSDYFLSSVPREMEDDSLFSLLDSDDELTRHILCEMLSKTGNHKDIDLLIRCLEDKNDEIKRLALKGLERLKDDRAINPILKLLNGEVTRFTRKRAVEALGDIGTQKAIEVLSGLLDKYETYGDKDMVIKALSKTGSPMAAEILVRIPVKGRFNNIHFALAEIGKASVPALRKSLDHTEESVKMFAIDCLMKIDDEEASIALYKALMDDSPLVRKNAIEALYKNETLYKKKDTPYSLISALGDNNVPHDDIIEYLGRKREKKALKAIKDIFIRDIEKGIINYSAITALNEYGVKEDLKKAVKFLVKQLHDKDAMKRYKVFKALGEIADESAVPFLIESLKSKDKDTVYNAIYTLGEIGSKKATLPLIEFVEDFKLSRREHGYIQEKIVSALGKIRDSRATPFLIDLLRNKKTVTGSVLYDSIIRSLSNIGGSKAEKALINEFKRLITIYPSRWSNVSALSFALIEISSEEAIGDLAPILKSGDIKTRYKVVKILGNIKSLRAMEILIDIAMSYDDLFTVALYELSKRGEPVLGSFLHILKQAENEKKRQVIRLIGNMKNIEAVIPLVQLHGEESIAGDKKTSSSIKQSLEKILRAKFPELFIPLITLSDYSKKHLPSTTKP